MRSFCTISASTFWKIQPDIHIHIRIHIHIYICATKFKRPVPPGLVVEFKRGKKFFNHCKLTETSRYSSCTRLTWRGLKLQYYECMKSVGQTCKSRCRLNAEEVCICRLPSTRRFPSYKWFLFISVILEKVRETIKFARRGRYLGQLLLGMCRWHLRTLPHYSLFCDQL